MELVKEIIVYVVLPLLAIVFKIVWAKLMTLEKQYSKMPNHEYCLELFAKKIDIATKKDIADMLDAKFERFELTLINEGRIDPSCLQRNRQANSG